jgi:hypothetical protein
LDIVSEAGGERLYKKVYDEWWNYCHC